ncbi:hypothetical protein FRB96_001046 [Tulasnella sp. 330]|nr:hypothetical protein FRB96_001046 [Tulasnella sp. 330]
MRVSSTAAFAVFAALATSLEALPVHDRPRGFADTEVVVSPRRILFRRDSDATSPPSAAKSGTTKTLSESASSSSTTTTPEAQSQPADGRDDADEDDASFLYVDLTDSSPKSTASQSEYKSRSGSSSSYKSNTACCTRSPARITSWDEPDDVQAASVESEKATAQRERDEEALAVEDDQTDIQGQTSNEEFNPQDDSPQTTPHSDPVSITSDSQSDTAKKETEDQWLHLPGAIAPELFDVENTSYNDQGRTLESKVGVNANDPTTQSPTKSRVLNKVDDQRQERELTNVSNEDPSSTPLAALAASAPTKTTKKIEESNPVTAMKLEITSTSETPLSDFPAATGTPIPTKTTLASLLGPITQDTLNQSLDNPVLKAGDSKWANDAGTGAKAGFESRPVELFSDSEGHAEHQDQADYRRPNSDDQNAEEGQDDLQNAGQENSSDLTTITPPPTGAISRASTTTSSSTPTTSWDLKDDIPPEPDHWKNLSNGQVPGQKQTVMTNAGEDAASQPAECMMHDQVKWGGRDLTDEFDRYNDQDQTNDHPDIEDDSSHTTSVSLAINIRLSSNNTRKSNTSSWRGDSNQVALRLSKLGRSMNLCDQELARDAESGIQSARRKEEDGQIEEGMKENHDGPKRENDDGDEDDGQSDQQDDPSYLFAASSRTSRMSPPDHYPMKPAPMYNSDERVTPQRIGMERSSDRGKVGRHPNSRSVESQYGMVSGHESSKATPVYSSHASSLWRSKEDHSNTPSRHWKPPIWLHRTRSTARQQQRKPAKWRSWSPSLHSYLYHESKLSDNERKHRHPYWRYHHEAWRMETVHRRPWASWHRKMVHMR